MENEGSQGQIRGQQQHKKLEGCKVLARHQPQSSYTAVPSQMGDESLKGRWSYSLLTTSCTPETPTTQDSTLLDKDGKRDADPAAIIYSFSNSVSMDRWLH